MCFFYCEVLFLFQITANHFRAFDVIAALQMKLPLPPHFLNSSSVFPLWPDMKSITHPPAVRLDEWPPLAVSRCCQMVSQLSLSPSLSLSLVINRRMQKGRTELFLTSRSSQKSSSTTAKVKGPNTARCIIEKYFVHRVLWLFKNLHLSKCF